MTEPSSDTAPFDFVDDPAAVTMDAADDLVVVRIPTDITSKPALLQLFARQLHSPQGFGRNWDAFRDDLLDLSWLNPPPRQLVIVHDDLPFRSGERHRLVYLSILGECAANSRGPVIRVLFPKADEATVQRLWRERI